MATMLCSSCKEKKFTNTKVLESRIKKYGSKEEAEAKWVCTGCRKSESAKPTAEVGGTSEAESPVSNAVLPEEPSVVPDEA